MSNTSKAVATVFSARTTQDKKVRGWYAVEKEGVTHEHVRMYNLACIMHEAYGELHWSTQNGNVIKNSPDRELKALAYSLAYIRQEQDKVRELAIKTGGIRMKPNNFIARLKMYGIWVDKKGTDGEVPTINKVTAFVTKERAKGNGDIPKVSGAASRKPRQPNPAQHSVVSKEVEAINLASSLKKLLDANTPDHSALFEELENFIIKARETQSAKAVKKTPTLGQSKAKANPLEKAFANTGKKLKAKSKAKAKAKAKVTKAKKSKTKK